MGVVFALFLSFSKKSYSQSSAYSSWLGVTYPQPMLELTYNVELKKIIYKKDNRHSYPGMYIVYNPIFIYNTPMNCIDINAYGKINIGLDVVGKRSDGYHEVKMIMQTIPLYDELSFEKTEGPITINLDNPNVPTDSHNLAFKAAKAFKEKYNIEGGAIINIKKHIPMAAGLAGGSADAAATLKAMATLYNIEDNLDELAVKLGADVPFCLRTGTYLSEGIGEKLTKLEDFPKCHVLLVNPGIEVSTKWAYDALDEEIKNCQKEPSPVTHNSPHPDIDKLIEAIHENDLYKVTKNMGNILEIPVLKKYPEIKNVKEQLENHGAIKALMSGSGSSVFAIFDDEEKCKHAYENVKGEGYVRFSFEFR